MISCLGWSADEIQSMRRELDVRSRSQGGKVGRYWWSFPRQPPARR